MNVYLLPVSLDNSMPEPYLLCPADNSIDDDFTCLPGNCPLEQAFVVCFFFSTIELNRGIIYGFILTEWYV